MRRLLPCGGCGAAVRRGRSGFFRLSGRHPHSRAQRESLLPAPEAVRLVPVTEETAADWAREYNARFRAVPAAASCSPAEERALAAGGEALWIWDGAERIGLGRVRGSELLAVAALLPGAGERCVRALAARCAGPEVRLTCAEENTRAMRLYDRLGFSRGAEERVWFSI